MSLAPWSPPKALTITARDSDTQASGTAGLECEESVLIGESLPAEKLPGPFRLGAPLAGLSCRALMGTVVHAGSGAGVAAASGAGAQSGRIAPGLGGASPRHRIPGRAALVLHDPGAAGHGRPACSVSAVIWGTLMSGCLHRRYGDRVPLEYSIAWLICAVTCGREAVMVG